MQGWKNKRPSVRLCVTQGFTTKGRMGDQPPPSSECTGGRFLLRYVLWRTERMSTNGTLGVAPDCVRWAKSTGVRPASSPRRRTLPRAVFS